MKRLALISEYEDGGLKMPHTESLIATQRIVCVKRNFDDSVRPRQVFLFHYLKNVGSEFLLKCILNYLLYPANYQFFLQRMS